MDMYAIGDREQFEYVLEGNRKDPKEKQVTFLLIGLEDEERDIAHKAVLSATSREIVPGKFNDDGSPVVAITINTAKNYDASKVACRYGIVGWRNFKRRGKNGEDEDVEFPGVGVKALALLRPTWIQELSLEILRASDLTEEEQKN